MNEPDAALVNDSRALLDAFARQDLSQLDVRLRSDVQLRLLREAPVPSGEPVLAPHVGTFVDSKADGAVVQAGEVVATIELLAERISLVATRAGVVSGGKFEPGELVQYGDPLVWVEDPLTLPQR